MTRAQTNKLLHGYEHPVNMRLITREISLKYTKVSTKQFSLVDRLERHKRHRCYRFQFYDTAFAITAISTDVVAAPATNTDFHLG